MGLAFDTLFGQRSQRAEAIRGYYEWLIDRLDRTPWHRPGGDPLLARQVAVPARVWKEVPESRSGKARPGEPPGKGEGRISGGEEPERLREMIDREIAALYEEPAREKQTEEVPWEREWRHLRRPVVVLGAPGGGKTFLTQATALALAEEGLKTWEGRDKGLEELPLPVQLDLDALGKLDRNLSLEDAMVELILRDGPPLSHLKAWIREQLPTQNCWLMLDALDQVKDEARVQSALLKIEAAKWKCRVVVTCRTANYAPGKLPWKKVTEYELSALGWRQMQRLVEKYYGKGNSKGVGLLEVLRRNFPLRWAVRNPLLLTMACLANEQHKLRPEEGRRGLYEAVLRDLIRKAWSKTPLEENDPHVEDVVELLPRMAWELFVPRPRVNAFSNEALKRALRQAIPSGAKMSVEDLRQELLDCGLLVNGGLMKDENGKNRVHFSYLHRTFQEYLVTLPLAPRPVPVVLGRCREPARTEVACRPTFSRSWRARRAELARSKSWILKNPQPDCGWFRDPTDLGFHHREGS